MPPQRKRNPNGAGTITKRKDGRYQAAVYVLQPDGTRARDTIKPLAPPPSCRNRRCQRAQKFRAR